MRKCAAFITLICAFVIFTGAKSFALDSSSAKTDTSKGKTSAENLKVAR